MITMKEHWITLAGRQASASMKSKEGIQAACLKRSGEFSVDFDNKTIAKHGQACSYKVHHTEQYVLQVCLLYM